MDKPLEGRVALVTGAGGGMGRSHAVLLAERGADVIVHDIKAAGVEETAEMVRAEGQSATTVVGDILDVATLSDDIKGAERAHGHIDILVNNAGVGGSRRIIEDITEDIFDQMFGVHVKGTFFATKAVIPGMKQRGGGKIVNISSIYAMGGSPLASHYAAAKAAISGFTKSWARELAPFRINVNAVAPGFVVTGMTSGSNPIEKIREREKAMPLGRFCDPIDISYAVAWLASAETDMISGQVVSPNSGEVIVGY